jgi:hypothetical protein
MQAIMILMLLEVAGADGLQQPTRDRIASSQVSNETRWRGMLKDQAEITMNLKREGQNLLGTVTYKFKAGPDSGPYEVKGKVEKNGKVILTEIGGITWEGRFISPSQITGVRPNGPANEPGVPKWPFTLTLVEILPTGSIKERTEAGPTSKDWSTFFSAFRAAVKNRDHGALTVMMSRNFEFRNEFSVPPDKVFADLDSNKGMNWDILEKTIAKGAESYKLPTSSRPARVAKNLSPCADKPCRYQAWVIFELDQSNQWRWKSMIFPGD